MKKSFFVILLIIFLCGCEEKQYEGITVATEINDKWYSGKEIIKNTDTDIIFFPLEDLANYLCIDYTENKRCSPSHPNPPKETREAIHLLKKVSHN